MRVLKKINNNVVVCHDSSGKELIAMGKGIGFPKTPYDLNDLSKIEVTFYRVSDQTKDLLVNIPEDVITISYEILKLAQSILHSSFSPNIVFSLADHIDFAIQRKKQNQDFDFSLSYDIKHLYPQEFQIGIQAIALINKKLKVDLPDSEAVAIALHFINAREVPVEDINEDVSKELFTIAISIIQDTYQMDIDINGFAYSRFRIHFKYFIERLKENKQISGEISNKLISDFIKENKKAAKCVDSIVEKITVKLRRQVTDDEMFYLMVYVNRLINKEEEEK